MPASSDVSIPTRTFPSTGISSSLSTFSSPTGLSFAPQPEALTVWVSLKDFNTYLLRAVYSLSIHQNFKGRV